MVQALGSLVAGSLPSLKALGINDIMNTPSAFDATIGGNAVTVSTGGATGSWDSQSILSGILGNPFNIFGSNSTASPAATSGSVSPGILDASFWTNLLLRLGIGAVGVVFIGSGLAMFGGHTFIEGGGAVSKLASKAKVKL